jgi:hypothetical protein
MNTQEKLQWCREHWGYLKEKGKLEKAVQRAVVGDNFMDSYSVQEIMDIEEACDEPVGKYLNWNKK